MASGATIAISDTTIGRPSTRSDYSARNFPDIASALESRRAVKLNPVSGATFVSGQKIRFYIPQGVYEVLDGLNSYMRFRLQSQTVAATTFMERIGAPAFFNRGTLRNNGVVLEDVQYMNRLSGLNWKATSQEYHASIGRITGSYPNGSPQNNVQAHAGYEFIYPMQELCLLNHELYIPLMYMGNSGIALDLEFEIEKQESIFNTAAGAAIAAAFQIYEVELILELVTMRQDWVTQGWAHLAEGKNIELPLVCWDVIRQSSVGTAITENIRFSNFDQSVKAIFAIFVLESRIDTLAVPDEYSVWYFPNLKDFQFRINVDLKPEQAIVCHASTYNGFNRAMCEVFKALRQYKDLSRGNSFVEWGPQFNGVGGSTLDATGYQDFCIGLVLDTHILGEDDNLVSGLNLRERAAPLELNLTKQAASSNAVVYIMVQHDSKIVINRGEVAVYK